jgi:hypothetical protein
MLDKKLKDLLDLAGGKAIIQDMDQYFILLTEKEFRKLKQEGVGGLTKQELVDKINNDIALWRVTQEEDRLSEISLEEAGKDGVDEIHYEKA